MAITGPDVVDLPSALLHYWTMWNEPDLDRIRGHLEQAVSDHFVFADPLHLHVGRDALENNVRTLRTDKPRYRFVLATELDVQNHCYRYQWHMMAKHRVLLRGLDVARIGSDGLLTRVDGFFGELVPTLEVGSAIPEFLRPPAALAATDGTN